MSDHATKLDYRHLFDAHPDPSWVQETRTSRILAVNRAAVDLYGYPIETFLGMDADDLVADTERSSRRVDQPMWHRCADGRSVRVVVAIRAIDWGGASAELVVARPVTTPASEFGTAVACGGDSAAMTREAEREMRYFRSLFDTGAGRYLIVSPETFRVIAVSDEFLTDVGMQRDEIAGRNVFDIFPAVPGRVHNDWAHSLRASLDRVKSSGGVDLMPLRVSPVPGCHDDDVQQSRWSSVNAPVVDDQGEIVYILHRIEGPLVDGGESAALARGIDPRLDPRMQAHTTLTSTELMRLHEQLRASEARYSDIFDQLPLSIWVEDWSQARTRVEALWADGVTDLREYLLAHDDELIRMIDSVRVIDVSNGTVDLFRAASKDEVIEAFSGDRIGDWEKEYFLRELMAFSSGQMTFQNDGRVEAFDGTQLLVESTAMVASDSHDTWSRVLTLVKDVTAQRAAQNHLSESEERFRIIADTAADAVWDWNLVDDRLWWSEGLKMLFGYDPEAIEPGSDSWRLRLHDDDRQRVVDTLYAAIAGAGGFWSAEYRFRRADDSYAWVSDRGHIIRGGAGRAVRMVGTLNDVTQSRELEARLRQSQRLEAVGQLTGGVAHDFNNLLTVVLGSAEQIAERAAGDAHIKALADTARKAAEHGAGLTERLLAFARSQPMDTVVTDIAALILDMSELLHRSLGGEIEIDIRAPEDLWPAVTDTGQIESAILNLAINARDAMPGGGRLVIDAANVVIDNADAVGSEDLVPGDYVQIQVMDNGTGMPGDVAARAFEPFFTTKDVGRGSGLGLSMVYGIMKQLGGHAHVMSEPGRGTTVSLYLPRCRRGKVEAGAVTPSGLLPTGCERVLVVEDDDLVREHVAAQLRSMGYDVAVAADGREALDIVAGSSQIDMLFTDVVMPGGINGPELARAARRLRPGLPVLFTSGYAGTRGVDLQGFGECARILNKPYRRQELAEKVREALETRHERLTRQTAQGATLRQRGTRAAGAASPIEYTGVQKRRSRSETTRTGRWVTITTWRRSRTPGAVAGILRSTSRDGSTRAHPDESSASQ